MKVQGDFMYVLSVQELCLFINDIGDDKYEVALLIGNRPSKTIVQKKDCIYLGVLMIQ